MCAGWGVLPISSNESVAALRGGRGRPMAQEGWGSQSIHSHVTKIEVITQKILEMNSRGDSRINEEKEEAKENKCWMQNLVQKGIVK